MESSLIATFPPRPIKPKSKKKFFRKIPMAKNKTQ